MAVVMLLLFGTVEDLLDSVYGLLLGIFLLSNLLRSTLRPFRALRIDSILCFNRTLASFGGDRCLYLGLKLFVRRSILLVAVLDDVVCDLPLRSPFTLVVRVVDDGP